MKAYKGFNKDMTCRGFQYEEGKTYETERAKMCEEGFHACEDPIDCLSYYEPATSQYHEVDLDDVSSERAEDSKVVAKKITIGARIELPALIKAGIDFRFSKAEKIEEHATGYRGAASATGESGITSATGYRGAASATGNSGAASATGNRGAASATGNSGAASATGYSGAASATGYRGAASATGESGIASATGESGIASATGYIGAASATGKAGVAVAAGVECKAKGAIGCALFLVERKWNVKYYEIANVKAVIVDGEKVKADTWYRLVDGEFQECE